MGNCSTNCNPCGPSYDAINSLASKTASYARQALSAVTTVEEFQSLYLGAKAEAPTTDNEGNPLIQGALYFNTTDGEMYVWAGSAWETFGQAGYYLGAKASDPTTDNEGNPLVAGLLYFNTTSNVMRVYNGTFWQNVAFDESTPFLASGTTTERNLVTRFADVVNVKDFGAIGDGALHPLSERYATLAEAQVVYPFATSLAQQIDWAAIYKSILYANSTNANNYKPTVYIPVGDYQIERIELNSLRAIKIVGESNQDHTRYKTVLRYVGGPGDAAIVIKSSSYIDFKGIRFDINNVSGLNSLIEFQGNAFDAVSPLNRFSSIKINFIECVFVVLTGISTPPDQTIFLKNCGGTNFERCVIRAGDSLVAVKIGSDSDNDPVTGLPTFANGMATTPYFYQTLFYGRIQREKSRQLVCDGCDFASAGNISGGEPSRITISGNGETTNELFINCGWDTVTVGSPTGILIEGGTNLGIEPPPCSMAIHNCQLGGAAVLVKCNKGDLSVTNCRGLPDANITANEFIRMEPGSGSLIAENNNAEEYVEGANSVAPPTLRADYIRDLRSTEKKMPILNSTRLSTTLTFSSLASWEDLITTPNFFFGGQYVRITYNINIKHPDNNAANYIARVYYGSTNINQTSRTITLDKTDEFGLITCSFIHFIPVQTAAIPIILKAQQSTGVGLGQALSTSTAQTTLTIEVLNY